MISKFIASLLLCLAVAGASVRSASVSEPIFAGSQPAATPPAQAPAPSPAPLPSSPVAAPAAPHSGYRVTLKGIPIFGSQLFQGDFKETSFTGFNPNYQVGIGDIVQIMIWGAMESALDLPVDAKGNIFIPKVGPIPVAGVRNDELNKVITARIRQVYKDNVESYAHLRSTQTVKVFVSGFVAQPGLYQGFSSDSVLFFLDRAGGIDPERGSYLNVALLRANEVVSRANLYDFLGKGTLPLTQFRDGDVILVEPRGHTVVVKGEVVNPGRFEFLGDTTPLDRILALASPASGSTMVSVRRAGGGNAHVIVVPLDQVSTINLEPGDQVEITGRNVSRNLLISYTGEHDGPANIVLPNGTQLREALSRIVPTQFSDTKSVQIFRRSVAERQKALLMQSLDNLERSVLNASSVSLEEAQLRQAEAETIFAFIKRAREVEPKGQIMLESLKDAEALSLEDGDTIHIPPLSSLVTVHGEVKYPNTQTYREGDSVKHYVKRAGGLSDNADKSEIIVMRPNGVIDSVGNGRGADIGPGDEIIVMPKPDSKKLLFAKEITTIIYQIALGARVAIGL
ncbi:MAG: polysialic acid transporter [Rariglobus sp.]|jgi:protein involved in polysaccharide export with SLBB domain|nr:polysialic acid transporter [Rariglobus sp.]